MFEAELEGETKLPRLKVAGTVLLKRLILQPVQVMTTLAALLM